VEERRFQRRVASKNEIGLSARVAPGLKAFTEETRDAALEGPLFHMIPASRNDTGERRSKDVKSHLGFSNYKLKPLNSPCVLHVWGLPLSAAEGDVRNRGTLDHPPAPRGTAGLKPRQQHIPLPKMCSKLHLRSQQPLSPSALSGLFLMT